VLERRFLESIPRKRASSRTTGNKERTGEEMRLRATRRLNTTKLVLLKIRDVVGRGTRTTPKLAAVRRDQRDKGGRGRENSLRANEV